MVILEIDFITKKIVIGAETDFEKNWLMQNHGNIDFHDWKVTIPRLDEYISDTEQ